MNINLTKKRSFNINLIFSPCIYSVWPWNLEDISLQKMQAHHIFSWLEGKLNLYLSGDEWFYELWQSVELNEDFWKLLRPERWV